MNYYEIEAKHKTQEDEWHPCGQTATSAKAAWNILHAMVRDFGATWNYRIVKVVRTVLK